MSKGESISVEDLTRREREVLILIGRGCSYGETARRLKPKISSRTVERYATQIRDKIGSSLPPLRAVILFYHENRGHFEDDGDPPDRWATGGLS